MNAAQGDTLEQAVMHNSKPPDGKLDSNAPYTAFTRVRGSSHLELIAPVTLELINWPQHADELAESRRLAAEEAAAQNLRFMLKDTQ